MMRLKDIDPRSHTAQELGVVEYGTFRLWRWEIGIGSRPLLDFKTGDFYVSRFSGLYVFLRHYPRVFFDYATDSYYRVLIFRRSHRKQATRVGDMGGFGQGFAAGEGARHLPHMELPYRSYEPGA